MAVLLTVITSPISSWEKSKSLRSSVTAVLPVTCTESGDRIGGTINKTSGIMIGVMDFQLCLYCLLGDHRIEIIPPNNNVMPVNSKNNWYRGAIYDLYCPVISRYKKLIPKAVYRRPLMTQSISLLCSFDNID